MAYRATSSLAGPLGTSVLLHALGIVSLLLLVRTPPPRPMPPIYRVNLIAAPKGPRAIGEVQSTPTPTPAPTSKTTEVPKARTQPPKKTPPPPKKDHPVQKAAKMVTPAQEAAAKQAEKQTEKEKAVEAPPPKAGGGPTGGKGADVALVRSQGVDFPFPAYTDNIVRQIALNFKPGNSTLKAEVSFIILRDGRVMSSSIKIVKSSGNYNFDVECVGAVEAAAKKFGHLPDGFEGDALPIVFSFDPDFLK